MSVSPGEQRAGAMASGGQARAGGPGATGRGLRVFGLPIDPYYLHGLAAVGSIASAVVLGLMPMLSARAAHLTRVNEERALRARVESAIGRAERAESAAAAGRERVARLPGDPPTTDEINASFSALLDYAESRGVRLYSATIGEPTGEAPIASAQVAISGGGSVEDFAEMLRGLPGAHPYVGVRSIEIRREPRSQEARLEARMLWKGRRP